jgi:hypothetical protein
VAGDGGAGWGTCRGLRTGHAIAAFPSSRKSYRTSWRPKEFAKNPHLKKSMISQAISSVSIFFRIVRRDWHTCCFYHFRSRHQPTGKEPAMTRNTTLTQNSKAVRIAKVEQLLREAAFVLRMTRRVKDDILRNRPQPSNTTTVAPTPECCPTTLLV